MTAPLSGTLDLDTESRWCSPLVGHQFGTTIDLRDDEVRAIGELGVRNLRRLQYHDPHSPATAHRRRAMADAVAVLLVHCAEKERTFWGWNTQEWVHLLGRDQAEFRRNAPAWAGEEVRPYLAAHAYLLGSFTEFHRLGSFQRLTLSWRIFGRDRVDGEIARLRQVLAEWGYRLGHGDDTLLPMVACQLFLLSRSPHLEDLGTELFDRVRRDGLLGGARLNAVHAVQRAVNALGFCDPPPATTGRGTARAAGGAQIWQRWVVRWYATSTLTPRARGNVRSRLLKVGRWIAAEHPDAADPMAWTRQTCATWVAALDRMNVGDYVHRTTGLDKRIGKPLQASTKDGHLSAIRRFFTDCQEWEWLPRRFDPGRALATPRSITALLGPNPRVIADDIWTKLLWAGLNLSHADLPETQSGNFYPFELVHAITLSWLFSGLRSDEITRLRVGCIRWQHDDTPIVGDSDQVLARDAVCLLDVPAHKTGTAFTKPVDPILGQALDTWHTLRPSQPARDVIKAKCAPFLKLGKPERRNRMVNEDDHTIVRTYGAQYRGLVEYYLLAGDVYRLNRLEWVMKTSMLKTLACKHNSTVTTMADRYKTTISTPSGPRRCFEARVEREGRQPLIARFGGIPLRRKKHAVLTDRIPRPVTVRRKELVTRLQAGRCELCTQTGTVDVHHVRALAELHRPGQPQPVWNQLMAKRRRKTLVVCADCHTTIHNG